MPGSRGPQGPHLKRRVLAATATIVALLVLLGCNSDNGDFEPQPLTPELETLMDQVASLRQLPTADGLRATTVPRSQAADVIEGLLTDEDRESFDELTTLYRLLGHLQPEQDLLTVYREFIDGAVAGFYSPPDKAFYVVSEADRIAFLEFDRQQKSTAAHEFVHALQDAEFDLLALGERTRGDLDWSLALSAIIEGDAVVHEGLWSRDFALALGSGRGLLFAQPFFSAVPSSIEREFRFPYAAGAEWVATVRGQRGNEAINGILRGRRLTTAEILHPELYDSGWEPAQVRLPDLSDALGEGWERESGGQFGEFQVRNFLQLKIDALSAVSAATGWAGDRYDVYANGGTSVAAFRLSFASSQEADEFSASLADWVRAARATIPDRTPSSAILDGGRTIAYQPAGRNDVLLVFGSDRQIAERALALLAGG